MDTNLLNEPVYAYDDGPNQEASGPVIGYVDHVYTATPTDANISIRDTKEITESTKTEAVHVLIKHERFEGVTHDWVELDA